jgi:hypothetical protein
MAETENLGCQKNACGELLHKGGKAWPYLFGQHLCANNITQGDPCHLQSFNENILPDQCWLSKLQPRLLVHCFPAYPTLRAEPI